MAYDGYMTLGGTELINVARTARLARVIGINTVRVRQDLVNGIESKFVGYGFGLGGFGEEGFGGPVDHYSILDEAPWFDGGVQASREFAGIIPLSMQGLDDSSLESTGTEYVGDGGNAGKPRNAMQVIVASVAIVASTERGAEFGKRWLDRVLRTGGASRTTACSGSDLAYFRYAPNQNDANEAPLVHRRNVSLTRGTSITRKRNGHCASTWLLTFTLTAADPFEYGEAIPIFDGLGGTDNLGNKVLDQGVRTLINQGCPVYDYSPIYDPSNPALVPSPTAPNFLPAGWTIVDGLGFQRTWAKVSTIEPSDFTSVPLLKISSTTEARMVRISIWPGTFSTDAQCDPLFSVVVGYLPANSDFYIDGEQQAAYVWDGSSDYVRRTDSIVFSPVGNPVEWRSFAPDFTLLVTVDAFAVPGGYQGGGNLRTSMYLIARSD